MTQGTAITQPSAVNASFGKYSGYIYALMRIVIGLLFACHGGDKLFGMFGGRVASVPLMQIGGAIELVGGFLVAFGLFTRVAAFICSGMMAVAYFMAHAKSGWLPIINKGELAVIYTFVFLYISARGAGLWSLDGMFGGRTTPADEVSGPSRMGKDLT